MIGRLILICVEAFTVSAATVWLTTKLAVRFGIFDPPGPLKIHRGPMARLGGIGIFAGFAVGVAPNLRGLPSEVWRLLPGVFLIWLCGLLDDLFDLSPLLRLAIQIISGCIVAAAYRPEVFGSHHATSLLYVVKTCFTVIVLTNAFNFLDGSDGVAAGAGVIATLGFGILMTREMPEWSSVAYAMAAACCGFLVFNFPPARIFMGDSGSTLLGFLLAVMTLRFKFSASRVNLAPLIIVAIPLIDFGLAVSRRVLSGRSIFEGDRFHFYDLLLQKGWSPRQVALCTYVAAIGCAALALTLKD